MAAAMEAESEEVVESTHDMEVNILYREMTGCCSAGILFK